MPTLAVATNSRQLRKRDQREVPFDAQKILNAITAAGCATGEFATTVATQLCQYVLEKLPEHSALSVEEIQDCVEITLMGAGHFKTARAYILYREQH